MEKAKKIISLFRKNWIAVWLVLATLSLCAVFSYARFANGQNYHKQVVATNYNDKVLFSSNYLKANDPKYPNSVPEGYEGERFFDVSVYNYDRTNATSYYPTTIRYSLKAVLKKSKGAASYQTDTDAATLGSIFGTGDNNTIRIYRLVDGEVSGEPIMAPLGKDNVSATLAMESLAPEQGWGSAVNTYRIVFPACVIDKDVYVEFVAEPAAEFIELPSHIGGMFYVKTNTVNLTTTWTGAFNDDQAVSPGAYDGFNYSVTGNGTATKVLSWDKTLLEPNRMEILEYFGVDITDASKYTDNGNMRSITIELSSAENGGKYNLQFYVSGDTSEGSARSRLDEMQWTGEEGLAVKVRLTDPE